MSNCANCGRELGYRPAHRGGLKFCNGECEALHWHKTVIEPEKDWDVHGPDEARVYTEL